MVAEIFAKVAEIARSGVAIVVVEQNVKEVLKLAHRGYVLAMGENRFEGSGETLRNHPDLGSLYLGS